MVRKPNSYWNYRVVSQEDDGEIHYSIREVYYTRNRPDSVTVEPCSLFGDTLEELRADIDLMLKAFDKPVLRYEGF